jgi:hypothetical protein
MLKVLRGGLFFVRYLPRNRMGKYSLAPQVTYDSHYVVAENVTSAILGPLHDMVR